MSEGRTKAPGFYRVCGGVLRSDLPFDELPRAETAVTPTWTLSMPGGSAPTLEGDELGEDEVTATATVRLIRGPDRLRLDFTDTGVFDVLGDGSEIRWYPLPDSDPDAAALDVIGRVLAVSFHASGLLCLHGSAVAFGSDSIAFLAPKYHGKSTTAFALTRAGARLVSDDMVAVELTDPARAHPGVHAVRLWEDSAEQIAEGDSIRTGVGGKLVLDDLSDADRMDEVTDLRAIYLLNPVANEGDVPAVERERTNAVESAMALIGQTKIGPLLGKSESPVLLERALGLAELVPVYRLRIVRDFERLPEVIDTFRAWHAGDPVGEDGGDDPAGPGGSAIGNPGGDPDGDGG